ncbi:type I restriction enzyme S subunit [Aminivibrio pyruvatiphilus]|jgi:type I restriction enzyme S subunit|uniref:Type I restriction enzyme S subunit n=1 Tax=Aminivibrio pyruvatiphilus TaxID=1005740 RepID=A0A4R8MB88_9BACT|nr:restriction endonuclease subunit S [Aminivibrio pyruvatiphilus]TDY62920.1 type I restriction enzyme S subunit [Aminivibrio pyruvatiphilus]
MSKWPLRKLGDDEICILNPKKAEVAGLANDTPVSFVPMARVDEISGTMNVSESKNLGDVRKGYTYFAEGDVVFAKITPCMENGKSAIARNLINGVGFGTTEFHVLRPRNLVTSEWLRLFVRDKNFREQAKKNMHGAAGQQRVPVDFLRDSQIPVPPIHEQHRIVQRIEDLTRRMEEVRKLSAQREEELDIFLHALYVRMLEGVVWKPLKEVASLFRRSIKTEPEKSYEEMGIRSFGKGTFKKPVLSGKQIGNKRIYAIHEGDLVFNNVFAWEKAIAVAKAEDHGRVGSHRFITYVPKKGRATSEFLCHHFLGDRGIEDIRAASPGSAGRNRTLGLNKLAKILVPVPEYNEQKRFSEIANRRQTIQQQNLGLKEDFKTLYSSLLAKAFRGEL